MIDFRFLILDFGSWTPWISILGSWILVKHVVGDLTWGKSEGSGMVFPLSCKTNPDLSLTWRPRVYTCMMISTSIHIIRIHYIWRIWYVNGMWMTLTWQWRHHWREIHENQGAKAKARPQVVTWHREVEKDWTSTVNICQTCSKLKDLVGCQLYFLSISCSVKVKELAPLVCGTQTDSLQWRKLFVEKQTCDVTTRNVFQLVCRVRLYLRSQTPKRFGCQYDWSWNELVHYYNITTAKQMCW